MKRSTVRYSILIFAFLGTLFLGARSYLYYTLEDEVIATRPNDDEVPDDFGAPSRQFQFQSGERTLHASVVIAENADSTTPALLLYHGRRETISRWAQVQALLYRNDITSMVFDYSGFGSSSGDPTINNLHEDGIAAWNYFTKHIASPTQPKVALAHSLGTGILMSGVSQLQPPPDLVILSAPWSTARDAVIHLGYVPDEIYYLLPDVWNNLEAARKLELPFMVVHGTEDRIVPYEMGRQVADTGNGQFIKLQGVGHRQIARHPTLNLWQPIIEAIHGERE